MPETADAAFTSFDTDRWKNELFEMGIELHRIAHRLARIEYAFSLPIFANLREVPPGPHHLAWHLSEAAAIVGEGARAGADALVTASRLTFGDIEIQWRADQRAKEKRK